MSLPSKEAPILEGQRFPIGERPESIKLSSELSGFKEVEALKKETLVLPDPIVGDDGAIILDNPTSQNQVTITLPLTDDQINQALHLKVLYSLRWLAEWAKRLLKITGGKFIYKF